MQGKFDISEFFSNPPRDRCTFTIIDPSVKGGHVPSSKIIFDTFYSILTGGVKALYNTNNLVSLNKDQIEHLRKYMRSIGVDPIVEANVDVETKEINAWRMHFQPLVPEYASISKMFVKFE